MPIPVFRDVSIRVWDVLWPLVQPALWLDGIRVGNLLWSVLIPVIWLLCLGVWDPVNIRMGPAKLGHSQVLGSIQLIPRKPTYCAKVVIFFQNLKK